MLGPLLFITYINDVTEVISPESSLNMFADDMAMYKVIKSPSDYVGFQKDIDAVSSFMQNKLLEFNATKCKFMLITRKSTRSITPPPLVLDDSVLQRVFSYKYLGITIACDLSWKPHITSVCNKTRKLVGLLHRRFSLNTSNDAMVKLYTSFVRPSLEYASIVWSPYRKGETQLIEKVQKFALKVCLKTWNSSYEDLLCSVNLPTLQYRRKVARICHLFKILHGLTDFPESPLEPRQLRYNSRFVNSLSLAPIKHRTFLYQNSFFPATITMWNKLVGTYNIGDYETVNLLKYFLYSSCVLDIL